MYSLGHTPPLQSIATVATRGTLRVAAKTKFNFVPGSTVCSTYRKCTTSQELHKADAAAF